jgi:hypothetical protein
MWGPAAPGGGAVAYVCDLRTPLAPVFECVNGGLGAEDCEEETTDDGEEYSENEVVRLLCLPSGRCGTSRLLYKDETSVVLDES